MFEWINELSAWLQSWLSTGAGLWGLFISAFASATVLPGSSEVVMTGLVTAYPGIAWHAFWVALAGRVTFLTMIVEVRRLLRTVTEAVVPASTCAGDPSTATSS